MAFTASNRTRAFSIMPEGEHLLEIKAAEVQKSKAGNVMIVVDLENKDEKKVRTYVTLTKKAAAHAIAFFNAVGITPKEVKAAGGVSCLIGRKVWAFTGVQERDGDRHSTIESWIVDQDTRTVGPQGEMELDYSGIDPESQTYKAFSNSMMRWKGVTAANIDAIAESAGCTTSVVVAYWRKFCERQKHPFVDPLAPATPPTPPTPAKTPFFPDEA